MFVVQMGIYIYIPYMYICTAEGWSIVCVVQVGIHIYMPYMYICTS